MIVLYDSRSFQTNVEVPLDRSKIPGWFRVFEQTRYRLDDDTDEIHDFVRICWFLTGFQAGDVILAETPVFCMRFFMSRVEAWVQCGIEFRVCYKRANV